MTSRAPSAHDPERNKHQPSVIQIGASTRIAECDRKLTQYRATPDAGASPATVGRWIAEIEAEKAKYEISLREVAKARERMTGQEIKSIFDKLEELANVLANTNADDKSEILPSAGAEADLPPGKENHGSTHRACSTWVFPKVSEDRVARYIHARHHG